MRFLREKSRKLRHRFLDDFVFIHINKTGGSSIAKALKLPFEHKTASEKLDEIGLEQWGKKFTFAIIRNPWDKVVSHYHYRVQKDRADLGKGEIDFKHWVKLAYRDRSPLYYDVPKMFMPQTDWVSDSNGKIICNFIGRFEALQADFERICAIIGKKAVLPHIKKSQHKLYEFYYDDETAKIIRDCFAKDIHNFGYQF